MKRFDGTEIDPKDAARFREFVNSHRWIFAKTYASFCPHEYTLRRESNREDFIWFAKFIWENGFWARWGRNKSKYLIDEDGRWYYFVFPVDFDEDDNVLKTMVLINRGSLSEFEFIEEKTLIGSEIICKRIPAERRV